jgi:type II secretory pathway component PulJ
MTTIAPRAIRSNGGFSLVDLLVGVSLSLLGMGTILSFHRSQLYAVQDQARQVEIQTTTRAIVDLFAREARRAGLNPACTANFTMVADASASQVRFQEDLNANGVLDAASEDITYRFAQSNRVERATGSSTDTLLSNVDLTGSRMRYFDGGGAELVPSPTLSAAQRTAIRRVRIEMSASSAARNPSRSAPLTARAATDVELRNRFFVITNSCP